MQFDRVYAEQSTRVIVPGVARAMYRDGASDLRRLKMDMLVQFASERHGAMGRGELQT